MSGPITLCNNKVKILSDNDTHALPGIACEGEIDPGNLFFSAIGWKMKSKTLVKQR